VRARVSRIVAYYQGFIDPLECSIASNDVINGKLC